MWCKKGHVTAYCIIIPIHTSIKEGKCFTEQRRYLIWYRPMKLNIRSTPCIFTIDKLSQNHNIYNIDKIQRWKNYVSWLKTICCKGCFPSFMEALITWYIAHSSQLPHTRHTHCSQWQCSIWYSFKVEYHFHNVQDSVPLQTVTVHAYGVLILTGTHCIQ